MGCDHEHRHGEGLGERARLLGVVKCGPVFPGGLLYACTDARHSWCVRSLPSCPHRVQTRVGGDRKNWTAVVTVRAVLACWLGVGQVDAKYNGTVGVHVRKQPPTSAVSFPAGEPVVERLCRVHGVHKDGSV